MLSCEFEDDSIFCILFESGHYFNVSLLIKNLDIFFHFLLDYTLTKTDVEDFITEVCSNIRLGSVE